MACSFCGEPALRGSWIEIRLYLGPGDKLGDLELAVCARHLARMRPAYERELVECRVTRWEPGAGPCERGNSRSPAPAAASALRATGTAGTAARGPTSRR